MLGDVERAVSVSMETEELKEGTTLKRGRADRRGGRGRRCEPVQWWQFKMRARNLKD